MILCMQYSHVLAHVLKYFHYNTDETTHKILKC